MHPLSTFEVHQRDQADLLRRSTSRPPRERASKPGDDAHGRPPDPRARRAAVGVLAVGSLPSSTA